VVENFGKLPYKSEGTNTTGGLYRSRLILTDAKYGPRGKDVPKVIVLITDGNPTYSKETLMDEVNNCRAAGIRIVVVGVTNWVDDELMATIANTEGDYIPVPNFTDLREVVDAVISDDTCTLLNPDEDRPIIEPEPVVPEPVKPLAPNCVTKWVFVDNWMERATTYKGKTTDQGCVAICNSIPGCKSINFNKVSKTCWISRKRYPGKKVKNTKFIYRQRNVYCPSLCTTTYKLFNNIQLTDVLARQPGSYTEQDCVDRCHDQPHCWSTDFNRVTKACYFGNRKDPLHKKANKNFFHRDKIITCIQPKQ